jgi:hypothetical protein
MANIQLFLVHGIGGIPTERNPENRVGEQDPGNEGRPVSSAVQRPCEHGHCRTRTRNPW